MKNSSTLYVKEDHINGLPHLENLNIQILGVETFPGVGWKDLKDSRVKITNAQQGDVVIIHYTCPFSGKPTNYYKVYQYTGKLWVLPAFEGTVLYNKPGHSHCAIPSPMEAKVEQYVDDNQQYLAYCGFKITPIDIAFICDTGFEIWLVMVIQTVHRMLGWMIADKVPEWAKSTPQQILDHPFLYAHAEVGGTPEHWAERIRSSVSSVPTKTVDGIINLPIREARHAVKKG